MAQYVYHTISSAIKKINTDTESSSTVSSVTLSAGADIILDTDYIYYRSGSYAISRKSIASPSSTTSVYSGSSPVIGQICVDETHVYFVHGTAVKKVPKAGGSATTLKSDVASKFTPKGIATSYGDEYVYVTNYYTYDVSPGRYQILKINKSTGSSTIIYSDSNPQVFTAAGLGIAADSNYIYYINLYSLDVMPSRYYLKRISKSGTGNTTIDYDINPAKYDISFSDVAVDDQYVYILNYNTYNMSPGHYYLTWYDKNSFSTAGSVQVDALNGYCIAGMLSQPSIFCNIDNVWKKMTSGSSVNIDGTWRTISDIYCNIDGVWKKA